MGVFWFRLVLDSILSVVPVGDANNEKTLSITRQQLIWLEVKTFSKNDDK